MGTEQISNVIKAQIDAQGHLLYADPAIRRLHMKAGGVDGGKIAIPSIANIAMLTHKLKSPLSRMVCVADQDFDIELWVDSALQDDVVTLSILGWNENHITPMNEPIGASFENNSYEDDVFFLCNIENQITSFQTGEKHVEPFGKFVGRDIFDIIQADNKIISFLRHALGEKQSVEHHIINIIGWDMAYEFSAIPRLDDTESFLGYECYISPLTNEFKVQKEDLTETYSETIYQGLVAAQLAPAIRQPLGRIIANADTIGSKLHGPIRENYANYAKDIADAARHLIEIVDDLGDLEALERPGFFVAQDELELGDIAKRLIGLLALKARDKNIEIEMIETNTPVYALGEFRRVLQIGLNILTNAVRYSSEGTKITISSGLKDNKAYLSVRDQGPGIDPDMHQKIFEKFERLGRTGDSGSGLGLYISYRLAHAMEGELLLDSDIGDGACFTLMLPENDKKKEAPKGTSHNDNF